MTPTTTAGKRLLDDLAGDTEGTTVLDAYRSGLAHDIAQIEVEAARLATVRLPWAALPAALHKAGVGCDIVHGLCKAPHLTDSRTILRIVEADR